MKSILSGISFLMITLLLFGNLLAQTYSLKLSLSGSGDGSIFVNGSERTLFPVTYHFVSGTSVELLASPNNNCRFDSWTGDYTSSNQSIFFTITRNMDLTAMFTDNFRKQDSLALIALYHSTDGDHWWNNTNWLTNNPIDMWHGVMVSEGRVIRLFLDNNQLSGQIPQEIGQLDSLIEIDLSTNLLCDTIPREIGQLTNLKELLLDHNQLSGSIPTEIGRLTELRYLSLYNNQLSGPIPPEIGLLDSLRELDLGTNQLSGPIPPEIAQLTNLRYLYLNENQLSDSIPSEIGQLSNLESLVLSANQLSGPILPEIGQLTNLKNVDLSTNQLSEPIPSEFVYLTNLYYLKLSTNQFTDLPDLSHLSLSYLFIEENRFTFEDIEPYIYKNLNSFKYSPQAKVGVIENITKTVGSSVTFSVTVGGTANQYQWFKDDERIPGATSTSYSISGLDYDDAGSYICQITNTIATELTLESHPKILIIGDIPNPDNMLLNGDFSIGTNHWQLWVNPAASASSVVQNGEYVVNITNGGNETANIQLVQLNLLIEKSSTYDISYDAYADASREIIPYMAMRNSPWTTYGGYEPVTLSTVKQNYVYSFTMNHATDADARIAFDLGNSNTNVTFDNMFLTKRRPANMLFNGEFTHGTPGWYLYVTSPAVASCSVQNGELVASITNGGNNSWDVQLNQRSVLLENGSTYQVSFDAYATSPRQIIPNTSMAQAPWTVYGGYQAVTLSTTKQTYTYSFTMNHATDPDARVTFNLGQSRADVYLDNIMLTKGTTPIEEPFSLNRQSQIFSLKQNYPNPFNSETHIRYNIARTSKVLLRVFDVQGREIQTRINEVKSPGQYTVTFNGQNLPSGIYFYHLQAGSFSETRKLILLR